MTTDATEPPSSEKNRGRPKLDPTVGARIRRIGKELLEQRFGGNVAAMAKALDRHPSAIRNVLGGDYDPSHETVQRMAGLIGVTAHDLYQPPSGGPDSGGIPTPRSKAVSSVYSMAQAAQFDEAFLAQWAPSNPEERDPDKLWKECKRRHEVWRNAPRATKAGHDQRRLIEMYFRRTSLLGLQLASSIRDTSDAALKEAVRLVYIEPPLSTRPDIVMAVSPSVDEAHARMPRASLLALAEYCFRSDIVRGAQESIVEIQRSSPPDPKAPG